MNAGSENDGGLIDFGGAEAPGLGSLDVAWDHGVRGKRAPAQERIQVHRYNEHTVILRQSRSVKREAPFMFLLFGNERAVLLDTGATAETELFPLCAHVDRLIEEWLEHHPREGYELVVAHTHDHGDHVAGDVQFADRPHTRVVAHEVEAVRTHFGFSQAWPAETVAYDLGGRVLDVMGSPGHHATAITFYDRWTGILFTGDTVLPGRLYAFDFAAFRASLDRMVAFTQTHPVTHVLGCHVEMTNRPRRDYPLGTTYQPDERAPQMTVAQLIAVRDAADAVAGRRGVHAFDDFIIYNEPSPLVLLRLIARGLLAKAGLSRA
ncbi:MBL fold metallo-hydrolase [Actinospica robiniae]|uniref:MBL fold metallo-hydrolase n=1 Tax=Actinospica robiniae TaxID=304901 RepID=UPI00040EED9C|nr:MBL fold metallo-hydrolase [Actinospica robiniae]